MQLTLVSARDADPLRLAAVGQISQTGMNYSSDPFIAAGGDDVYRRRVAVNTEKVSYIDSGGISLLIVAQKRFVQNGGKMVLHSIPPLVRQVLDLLHLGSVLTLAGSEEDAVKKLGGGS